MSNKTEFKSYTKGNKDAVKYNKKVMTMYLTKIVFANTRSKLQTILDKDPLNYLIINNFIEDLLQYEQHIYYKKGSLMQKYAMWDDTPDNNVSIIKNRQEIQNVIKKALLQDIGEFNNTEEYFSEYLQLYDQNDPEIKEYYGTYREYTKNKNMF